MINIKKIEEDKANHTLDVTVDVDQDAWKKTQKNVIKHYQKNISIPGFRKGHVSEGIIIKQLGQSRIWSEAIQPIVQQTYNELIKSEKIKNKNIIEDSLDTKVNDANSDNVEITYSFSVCPEIKLFDYKNIKIDYQKPTVSDTEIDNQINMILKRIKPLKETETTDPIKNGDIVMLTYKGTVDGKPFMGSDAENYEITVGKNELVPGLEEKLIGHKAKDKFDLTIKLPADFMDAQCANKDANYHVEIISVKNTPKIELDTATIQALKISGVHNEKELREFFSKRILEQKNSAEKERIKNLIVNKIVNEGNLDFIPKNVLETQINWFKQQYSEMAAKSKMSLEDYVKEHETFGSMEKFNQLIEEQAIKNSRLMFAVDKIASDLGIEVKSSDIDDEIIRLAISHNISPDQVRARLANNMEQVEGDLLQNKLFNKLIEINIENEQKAKDKK